MPNLLALLSSFLEANGLGGPNFWGRSILVLQGLHLLINTYLESRFLVPFLSVPSSISTHFPAFLLSLYFVLLQCVAIALLALQLFLKSMILPLILVHLVLIASILLQLIQMLVSRQPSTELFIWCWYLSACVTFTLYQAMLFSTVRSPKLSASIAPAPTRARRVWQAPRGAAGRALIDARV